MSDEVNPNSDPDAMMRQISEALGASVESLFGDNAQASTLSLTNEMLSLWLKLDSDESRTIILNLIRAAVSEQAK